MQKTTRKQKESHKKTKIQNIIKINVVDFQLVKQSYMLKYVKNLHCITNIAYICLIKNKQINIKIKQNDSIKNFRNSKKIAYKYNRISAHFSGSFY